MRASAALSRLLALVFVGLLATATLTYGAERTRSTARKHQTAAAKPKVLLVPDVQGKPYVFAEGVLEEKGFAWRVTGRVAGFAANSVVSQAPAAGTRVVDTGAPTVTLALRASSRYAQVGVPQNKAPFPGSAIRLPRRAPAVAAAKAPKSSATAQAVATRPPAFLVPGAPPEPLSQPSLSKQARQLDAWLQKHRQATAANRAYLSYRAWLIVTGARNGWSHGADALELLIAVEQRAERAWRIGSKDRLQAEKALLEVRARAR